MLSVLGVSQAIRVPPREGHRNQDFRAATCLDGYRLVQLTDLHISRLFPAYWAERIVKRTNGLEADLIVVTGDFIDGSVENRRNDVAPLAGLRARDGVYAIPATTSTSSATMRGCATSQR